MQAVSNVQSVGDGALGQVVVLLVVAAQHAAGQGQQGWRAAQVQAEDFLLDKWCTGAIKQHVGECCRYNVRVLLLQRSRCTW
jgi:hypothetical protein